MRIRRLPSPLSLLLRRQQRRRGPAPIYFAIPAGDRLGQAPRHRRGDADILSGAGELLTDDGAQQIRPGRDVFVLREGVSHDLHNTGDEDLRVLAFFSKPQLEQHWDVETWPPDDAKVTGSPNRDT